MNYSRGRIRLWIVCWALVTGYYIWSGLVAESDMYASCLMANGSSGCMHNKTYFLLGPILLSIIAFIFVPILFIGALGLARLLGSGGFWTLALGTAAKPKSVRADSFKLPSRKFDRLPIASSGADAGWSRSCLARRSETRSQSGRSSHG
jgi:hypothetical protein